MRTLEAIPKKFIPAFVLTAVLVVLWGIGHRLYDALMPMFSGTFGLHGFHLVLTQNIYGMVYLFAALPAAIYARTFGYKATILLGLGLLAAGAFAFYPAAETQSFAMLVIATGALALGWLTLEIAVNPLIAAFGSLPTATLRLNFAQCLYPIGAIIGVVVGRWLTNQDLVMPHAKASFAIGHPYIVIGAIVLLLAFLIEEVVYPDIGLERIPGLGGIRDALRQILKRPAIRFAIVAQAASITALGALWTANAPIVQGAIPQSALPLGNSFLLATIIFALGRIAGTGLMARYHPAKILASFMLVSMVLAVIAVLAHGLATALATLALSFFLAIAWPTILGLGLSKEGQDMKLTTAILAIAGTVGGLFYSFLNLTAGGLPIWINLVLTGLSAAAIWAFAHWTTKHS